MCEHAGVGDDDVVVAARPAKSMPKVVITQE
jgi:hypothetical protein